MRSLAVLSVFVLAACAATPPPAPPVVAVAASAPPPIASVAPALPDDPVGLRMVVVPTGACTVTGELGDSKLAILAGDADPHVIANVTQGTAKLVVDANGGAFTEITNPAFTLRGAVRDEDVQVRFKRWQSFGGVFFPGFEALAVRSAADGKITVDAPDVSEFTLDGPSQRAEFACEDLTLAVDPEGALTKTVPPSFAPVGTPRVMRLKAKVAIPLAPTEKGAPVGSFEATDALRTVVVSDHSGSRSLIRRGHLAGWVDSKLVVPPPPPRPKKPMLDAIADREFGMIAILTGGPGAAPKADPRPVEAVVCNQDTRLIAEVPTRGDTNDRWVVGSLPAGRAIRIVDKRSDVAYIAPPVGLSEEDGVRWSVPIRDLVACAPAAEAAPTLAQATHVPSSDAIDELRPDAGSTAPTVGTMWGNAIGDSFGAGGLGLSGIGEGAGGQGEGIGLGSIGTLGHGSGVGGSREAFDRTHVKTPTIKSSTINVNGRLPPEVIQRIVRQNFGRFRLCYENGLRAKPTLAGRVAVKFVIDRKGDVSRVSDGGSTIGDPGVVGCVVRAFSNLSFPAPEGGIVTVVFPLTFAPGS